MSEHSSPSAADGVMADGNSEDLYEARMGIGADVFVARSNSHREKLTGTIKAKPADFCVSEVLDVGAMTMTSAGSEQETTNVSSNDTSTQSSLMMACFNDAPLDNPQRVATHPTPSASSSSASIDDPSTLPVSNDTTIAKPNDIDWKNASRQPKETLQRILAACPTIKLVELSLDDLVEKLTALQQCTLQRLSPTSGEDTAITTPTGSLSEVTFTLEGETTPTQRGMIHQWVRSAFCLLQTHVVTTGTSQMTAKDNPPPPLQVMVLRVLPDDRFFGLVPFLHSPSTNIPALYRFFRSGNDTQENGKHGVSQRRGNWKSTQLRCMLPLRPDLPRSERRDIHQILSEKSGRQFASETTNEYQVQDDQSGSSFKTTAIAVTWSVTGRRNNKRKRQDGASASTATTTSSRHTLLVLRKRNVEHRVAMHALAKAFRCRLGDIQYAGIKDRVAITTQFITLHPFVSFTRIHHAQAHLRSQGLDLCGPVRLVPRGLCRGQLQGNQFNVVVRDIHPVTHADFSIRDYIDASVNRVCHHGFVNFFGDQRIGRLDVDTGTRAVDIGRALLQRDWSKAVDLIMRVGTDANSAHVAQVWQASGGDLQQSWNALAKSQGNQSRQRMLLQTLRRHGSTDTPLGLRSLSHSDRSFWISAYQAYLWNMAATARIRKYGCDKVVVGDLVCPEKDTPWKDPLCVTTLAVAKEFTVKDIVLPLPGHQVEYPSNQVGQVYQETMANDGIKFLKNAPVDATAKGAYRPLLGQVENFSYEWLGDENQSPTSCSFTFELSSGSYATMLLRELLGTAASTEHQGSLCSESETMNSTPPSDGNVTYNILVEFAYQHLDFQMAELDAVLRTNGIILGEHCLLQPLVNQDNYEQTLAAFSRLSSVKQLVGQVRRPFVLLTFPADSPWLESKTNRGQRIASVLLSRCVLVRSVSELWAMAPSIADCAIQVKQWTEKNDLGREIFDQLSAQSWKVTVHTLGSKYTIPELNEMRKQFDFLEKLGPVKLNDCDNEFILIREIELDSQGGALFPRFDQNKELIVENDQRPALGWYFGRILGNRHLKGRGQIETYSLKNRAYLGPTSMDTELSLVMTNLARIKRGSMVIDPFVGTGSILLAAAIRGAYCVGTDIDIRVLRGKSSEHNVFTNFAQYGLPRPELIRSDNALYGRHFCMDSPLYDAIVTDPPYGIRAGARRSGSRREDPRAIPEERRHDHIAQTKPYAVSDVMADLIDMAARTLVLGGRLVYIIPSMKDFSEDDLPRHPCLELSHVCYQPLSLELGRRMVAMEKVAVYDFNARESYLANTWKNGPESAEKCANLKAKIVEAAKQKPDYKEKAAIRKMKRKNTKEARKRVKQQHITETGD